MEPRNTPSKEEILSLIEKYWAGETSLEEEQWLKDTIGRDSGKSEGLSSAEIAVFTYLSDERSGSGEVEDLDEKVLAQIHKERLRSGTDKTSRSVKSDKSSLPPRINLRWISGIAAGIVIALFATYQIIKSSDHIEDIIPSTESVISEGDTFTDPQEAYEETMKALMLVSRKLNQGREQASRISVLNDAQLTVSDSIIN